MWLILMKQFSFLFGFIFIVFFVLTECLLESWDMFFKFYVMLFHLFFNCSGFIYFLFDCFQCLVLRLVFFFTSFCFSIFLLFFTFLCLLFLLLLFLNNLLNLNLLLNILNLLPNTRSINSNINKDILNISNMYWTHHKFNNKIRNPSYIIILMFFLPIWYIFSCKLFNYLITDIYCYFYILVVVG